MSSGRQDFAGGAARTLGGEEITVPAAAAEVDAGAAPKTVGRFDIRERLGSGGMGEVFLAWDPELGRDVAVKVLHTRARSERARARMMGEAQAMARLSHDHVVGIYDVGLHGEGVFIAMEYLDGGTLQQWLEAAEAPWTEVLNRFVAAGRGLEAAHAAGLVHRDFKPANVMLGRDGRVRVGDFGLAKAFVDSSSGVGEVSAPSLDFEGSGSRARDLTEQGTVVGTPHYMAPEHLRGVEANPFTDQYSFCVSLYQGLYRHSPFVGRGREQARAKQRGELVVPARGVVPHAVFDALARGMAPLADERWPSMTELLTALQAKGRRPVRWLLVAVPLTAVGIAGLAGADASDACDAEAEIETAWNADERDRMAKQFAASEVAADWRLVERKLDDWVQRWSTQRSSTCTTASTEEESQRARATAVCLQRARSRFSEFVDVLAHGDEVALGNAVLALAKLPNVEACIDKSYVDGAEPTEPRVVAMVQQVRTLLDRGTAQSAAGKYEEAIETFRSAIELAQTVEHPPTRAEAWLELGGALNVTSQYDEAARTLERVYFFADEHGLHRQAGLAAVQLAAAVGHGQARPEEGLQWIEHARGHLRHVDDPLPGVVMLAAEGLIAGTLGDQERALQKQSEAIAFAEKEFGPDSYYASQGHNNYGLALVNAGRSAEAIEHFERSTDLRRTLLGPEHPLVAWTLSNLGVALKEEGRYHEARAAYEEALQIVDKRIKKANRDSAGIKLNMGVVCAELDLVEEAEHHYRDALVEYQAAHGGEDHPQVAKAWGNLGGLLQGNGRVQEGLEAHQKAQSILERTVGAEHPTYGNSLHNSALAYQKLGRAEDADREFRQAVELLTAQQDDTHPTSLAALTSYGHFLVEQERFGEAVVMLERAESAYAKTGRDDGLGADIESDLEAARAHRVP